MMRRLLPLLVLLHLSLGAVTSAYAANATDHLDRASACQRRGKTACTLEYATRALDALGDQGEDSLRREALRLRASALALLDRTDEAQSAYRQVLTTAPDWRPAAEDDRRIKAAFEEARREHLRAQLPKTLEPRPLPLPEAPDILPPLTLHRPDVAPSSNATTSAPSRWAFALGGGVAIPLSDSDHLYVPGPVALADLSYRIWDELSIWAQASITLLGFQEDLWIEPGFGQGITLASGSLGISYSLPMADWIDAHIAGGLGLGGFGVYDPGEALGLTLEAALGFRFRVDRFLAIRVEVLPTLFVPGNDIAVGGHLSAVARGELRF